MPYTGFTEELEAMRQTEEYDPRCLHDAAQGQIAVLKAKHGPVPAKLREVLADLEADIADRFYGNLPV